MVRLNRRHWLEVVGPAPNTDAFDRLTRAIEAAGYEFIYGYSEPEPQVEAVVTHYVTVQPHAKTG